MRSLPPLPLLPPPLPPQLPPLLRPLLRPLPPLLSPLPPPLPPPLLPPPAFSGDGDVGQRVGSAEKAPHETGSLHARASHRRGAHTAEHRGGSAGRVRVRRSVAIVLFQCKRGVLEKSTFTRSVVYYFTIHVAKYVLEYAVRYEQFHAET